MTAIAYRDGILAADTAEFADYNIRSHCRKIASAPDGTIGAAAGDAGTCVAFEAWLSRGMLEAFKPDPEDKGFQALLVSPHGKVSRMTSKGIAYESRARFHALGSCEELLVGAMAAGASAEQAVRIAIEHHVYAGGEVSVARITGAV